ncbi:hypothetical protein IV203_029932 [Nitzschia inconspicua]|uniref:Uncharacterized protein n=1 Tax=Nitzschia inconspicua TaxID=303405 RepID=A0A9K3LV68_9STRA|nr:hypothetical protein IV203_029932 [Nitzschia inconspicua]
MLVLLLTTFVRHKSVATRKTNISSGQVRLDKESPTATGDHFNPRPNVENNENHKTKGELLANLTAGAALVLLLVDPA